MEKRRNFASEEDSRNMMKNVALYIDMTFCLVLLPLMIYAFPVERWWGTYPAFFSMFVAWLYVTYFVYKYFVIPKLFCKGRQRVYAIAAVAISLTVTFFFSTYEITSRFIMSISNSANSILIRSGVCARISRLCGCTT